MGQQPNTTYRILLFLIAIAFGSGGCGENQQGQGETFTYNLGTVAGFCELVAADVKKLALSPVLEPSEVEKFQEAAEPAAARYGVSLYRESDLIVTDLFPDDVAVGKEVLLIGKGPALQAYQQLKKEIEDLQATGQYTGQARRALSRRFGRMLSYSPQKINSLLAENTDFRTMADFGIRASNVFLYYKDLPAATTFYRDILGLELLTTYDNASIFRMSQTSLVILVDAAKGMHSADEPKTVALAFLTYQLREWWDHLKSKGVQIKYPYKSREGSPHDGFVAIDPEGYLLEFEEFKQHPENEDFIPLLAALPEVETSIDGLSLQGSITWLYYKDVLAMQGFYEKTLGLKLVADQGWTKIYQSSPSGFIGLVDERRGMHSYTDDKAVTVSFLVDDLDGWYEYVKKNELFELRSEGVSTGPDSLYRAFVGFDPEAYYMEFDRFYAHEVNTSIMTYFYNN